MIRVRLLVLVAALFATLAADAQTTSGPPVGSATATPDNAVLLTGFLKHDQSKPLSEINAALAKQGFYKAVGMAEHEKATQ